MPPVTSWATEDELATWLLGPLGLGQVASVLGWTEDNLADVIARALRLYGVTDVADATDIGRLEAIATREAWRAAIRALVVATDITIDGETVKRSDMIRAAQMALELADAEAAGYGESDLTVSVAGLNVEGNPYDYGTDDSEWSGP